MPNDVNHLENKKKCDEISPSVKMFLWQEEEESLLRKDLVQAENIESNDSKTYLQKIEDLTSEYHRTLNKLEVMFKLFTFFEIHHSLGF